MTTKELANALADHLLSHVLYDEDLPPRETLFFELQGRDDWPKVHAQLCMMIDGK